MCSVSRCSVRFMTFHCVDYVTMYHNTNESLIIYNNLLRNQEIIPNSFIVLIVIHLSCLYRAVCFFVEDLIRKMY